MTKRNKVKKIVYSILTIWLVWISSIALAGQSTDTTSSTSTSTTTTNNWMPWQNTKYKIQWREVKAQWSNYLLNNTISLINRIMSMISVVTLVVLLIWWFKMITANWDEWKYKKWFTILKHAAIWLVIIWLSRGIIRLIFRFIKKTDTNADYDTDTTAFINQMTKILI